MGEITLLEYFEMFVKRKWIIIIISILTALASFLVSKFLIVPTYSATATLIVGNSQVSDSSNDKNYDEILFYNKLVTTYSKILQSKNVLNDVVYKLPFNTTVEDIEKNLTITTKQETLLINVTTKDKNAERAMEISNQISNSFVEKIVDIVKLKQNVNIVDLAEMPKVPVFPNILLNTLIGFFVGLMISMFTAYILEYLDNTMKSPEDIKKHLDVPIIGVIPLYDEVEIERGGKNS